MPAGGLVTAGVIAAGTLIYGAVKKAKAKKQQAALNASRPKYEINEDEQELNRIAQTRANQGISARSRQILENNAERNLSTVSNAALMGGADANAMSGMVDNSQNAFNQIGLQDDQVRLANFDNYKNALARNSANRDKQWAINVNQPWKDSMSAVSGQVAEGDAIMNNGISQLGSAAGGIAKSFANSGGGNKREAPTYPPSAPATGYRMMDTGQNSSGQMGYSTPEQWGLKSNYMDAPLSSQYPTNQPSVNLESTPYSYWGGM